MKLNSAQLFLSEPHFTSHWVHHIMADVLTSCRQLFGVDYFCGIFLSCTQFNTSAHHGKGSPVKQRKNTLIMQCYAMHAIQHQSQTSLIFLFLKLHETHIPSVQTNGGSQAQCTISSKSKSQPTPADASADAPTYI